MQLECAFIMGYWWWGLTKKGPHISSCTGQGYKKKLYETVSGPVTAPVKEVIAPYEMIRPLSKKLDVFNVSRHTPLLV